MPHIQLLVRGITVFMVVSHSLISANSILAILPLNGHGLTQQELTRLDNYFRWEMFRKDTTLAMYPNSMFKILLEKELKADAYDCDDLNCAKRIGRELSVKYVTQSSIAKSDNSIVFFLRVVDIKDGRIVMSAEEYVYTGYIETLMVQHLPMVVQRVVASCRRREPKE